MRDATSTIFALSSGRGRAGVAVIRVSGPAAGVVLDQMATPRPKPRFAAFRRVRHPETGEVLDEALVLWFPAPKSETGEDMAELQIHGGGAVIRAVLGAIGKVPGCRPAEAGEYARRAFENGRIDLTVVEGLADLVDAETEAQRRQALRQAGGGLQRLYDGWRGQLLEALALAEAAIDFSDEGDVARDAIGQAVERVQALAGDVRAHLAEGHRGEIVRDGFRVVLAGAPNAGKSSLINALSRREVAIVSTEAGTTRDVLEVQLDLGGYAVVLTDTAGLREASGGVEQEGVRRAVARVREADLVLWVIDQTVSRGTSEAGVPEEIAGLGAGAVPVIRVLNKEDLVAGSGGVSVNAGLKPGTKECGASGAGEAVRVSATTGLGLDRLMRRVVDEIEARIGDGVGPPPSQARHREQLAVCLSALETFLAGDLSEAELRAEDLRLAADALGRITGRIGVEDVLGVIFGRFCIGK